MKNNNKIPVISIVIPTYNGGKKLQDCIGYLLKQSCIFAYDIIVVDNGSQDNSIEKIPKKDTIRTILRAANDGFTVAANQGIREAQGKYVLLLNNDAYLKDSGYLQKAYERIRSSDDRTLAILPTVYFNWASNVVNSTFVYWHRKFLWFDPFIGRVNHTPRKKEQKVFGGMFIAPLFNKNALRKIGLFDETYVSYAEDFDLCYRAQIYGYHIIHDPELTAYHDFRSSSNDTANPLWSYFFFLRNYLITILKNYSFKNILTEAKYYLRFIATDCIRVLKNGDIKRGYMLIRVLVSIMFKSTHIIREHKKLQQARTIPDEQIWDNSFTLPYNPFYYNDKIVINQYNFSKS